MTRGYYRVFITLKEDTPGYSAEGRPPQGRCVIEARFGVCRVTIYAQDLRPQALYKVYLVRSGGIGASVCLGKLDIGPRYRGERQFELKPDVGGEDLPIEEYDAAAVVVLTHDGYVIPLSGGGEGEGAGRWRQRLLDELNAPKRHNITAPADIVVPKDTVMPEDTAVPVEAYTSAAQDIETLEEPTKADISFIPFSPFKPDADEDRGSSEDKEIVDQLVHTQLSEALLAAALMSLDTGAAQPTEAVCDKEQPDIPAREPNPLWKEDAGFSSDTSPHLAFRAIIQRFNRELDELTEITSGETPPAKPEIAATDGQWDHPEWLMDHGVKTQPFGPEGGDWICVSLNQLTLFPVNMTDYELNALLASAYYRHGHLLVNKNAGGYALAVPGQNSPKDAGYMERMGFRRFLESERGKGYWIKDL